MRATIKRSYEKNKPKRKAKDKEWRVSHRPHLAAKSRRLRTGWTPEAFEAAWTAQQGCCFLCGCPMKRLGHAADSVVADHVDEADGTKTPRALLCNHCNRALGLLKEKTEVLLRAVEYILMKGKIT